MTFIPHSPDDIQAMLNAIGVDRIDTLFDEIPKSLSNPSFNVTDALSEGLLMRLMMSRAPHYQPGKCFIGAGAYEHDIPAAIWDVTTRGEFYTCYTPYQPEVSQGTLQVIYEYQTLMTRIMAMEVSNASMYDGASALAESILMALRLKKDKATKILLPRNLHPLYQQTLKTIFQVHDYEFVAWDFDAETGLLNQEQLNQIAENEFAAVVIVQPNFFGGIEAVNAITNLAHQKNAYVIACVNPLSMIMLTPPGEWGDKGADIVCGEGQPLGVPLSGGGPYFGFMCCRKQDVRQMPGRIVGRTKDRNGKDGFVLTLQAREQHIRRAKATSNICTNQGLLVTAATIYMRLKGAEGLLRVAEQSHQQTMKLKKMLSEIKGVTVVFDSPVFHEFVIRLDKPLAPLMKKFHVLGFQPGLALENYFPDLQNCLLLCATETKTDEDIAHFVDLFKSVI